MCWVHQKQIPVKQVSEGMILPKPKLKVLKLNTNYYIRDNKAEVIWDSM